MYEALPTFMVRAPLLPERAWRRARALEAHPLGATALGLASADLAAASDSPARRRAVERYSRRAAFRATPSGLLAGVCVGALGEVTSVATGTPRPVLAPTWARLAALGRALLDDEAVRRQVRLRVAPSFVRTATTARWLGPGDPFAELREAELDDELATIVDAATRWTRWASVRRAVAGATAGDADELLLVLVDEGLLHADVTPPLVGIAPARWMRERLARMGHAAATATLDRAVRALDRGDLEAGAAALAALPGATSAPAVHGVLVHQPTHPPTLARDVVARAAALVPLLFRLQDALAPPASERLAQPALGEALEAATELLGAGALDLGAFDAGDYGGSPSDVDDQAAPEPPAPPAVAGLLVDAVVRAARAGSAEAALDFDALATALGEVGPAPPPSCELFLTPTRSLSGAGWGLGLHAPAGASWGRFASALGAPLARALEALEAAERAALPDHEVVDVAFAPSPTLAELCAHPRARRRALALSSWPDAGDAPDHDLTLADLELCADPGGEIPLALRPRGGAPVVPSPLARVRSTAAPAGAVRLLAGWSLVRQHAPWALVLGPLAALEHVPRLTLDGFVVAPRSWRLPEALRAAPADPARLARWRRDAGLPRFVQIGHEDQLLPVDLDADGAAAELVGHERAWEIWPPPGRSVDADGRRVEVVCALVDRPDEAEARALTRGARAVAAAISVPPPRLEPPPRDWRTFKIFGAPAHQDALLVDVVRPFIEAERRARRITGWFFQRYVEGAGRRHHLRLRVRARSARALGAFGDGLAAALEAARAAGAVVALEAGDYHPERARFGHALDAVHAIFESDSDAACALLEDATRREGPHEEEGPRPGEAERDRITPLVLTIDALARGLGFEGPARLALAASRRAAAEATTPVGPDARAAADAAFRARARSLRTLLAARSPDAIASHAARVARAVRAVGRDDRAALAPSLLHLACVRLVGPDRDVERLAYTLWERTLEGLDRAPVRARP